MYRQIVRYYIYNFLSMCGIIVLDVNICLSSSSIVGFSSVKLFVLYFVVSRPSAIKLKIQAFKTQ